MTVDESLAAFAPVLARAGELGWWRRGYVSTAFGCPYTGAVAPERAVEVALRLLELGRRRGLLRRHDRRRRPGPGRASSTALAVDAGIAARADRVPLPRHARHGARQRRGGPRRRRPLLRRLDRRHRRLPVRPGRGRATSRPRTSSTCSTPRATSTASTSTASSTPRGSSPTRSASRSRRRSARPAAGTPRPAPAGRALTAAPVEPQSSDRPILVPSGTRWTASCSS